MATMTPQGDPIEPQPDEELPANTPMPQDQFNQPEQVSETEEPSPPPPSEAPPDDQLAHYRARLQQPTTGDAAIADLRAAVLVLLERAG